MARPQFPTLSFEIDSSDKEAVYKQIALGFIKMINEGLLRPGDFLPGTKILSSQLNIARATVVKAYNMLIEQHYLETVAGIGTRVSLTVVPVDKEETVNLDLREKLSDYALRIDGSCYSMANISSIKEANFGGPPLALLPEKEWKACVIKQCRELDAHKLQLDCIDPLGNLELRKELSKHLKKARRANCDPNHIAVFPGSLFALNLVVQLFTNPGDTIGVENPGYPYARELFQAQGGVLELINIDDDGIIVDELENSDKEFKLIYLTPSHQDPTGATLSLERRKQLLQWAKRTNTIIVEDDFDAEYRHEGPLLPCLQGLDDSDNVVYINSFWKSFYPLCHIGYMIIPRGLVEVIARAELFKEGKFSLIEMFAMTEFLKSGKYAKYISKTASVYKKRLQNMIRTFTTTFGTSVKFKKHSSGYHKIIQLDTRISDEDVTEIARQSGLPLISTKFYYSKNEKDGEFVVVFAHLSEEEMNEAVSYFEEQIKSYE